MTGGKFHSFAFCWLVVSTLTSLLILPRFSVAINATSSSAYRSYYDRQKYIVPLRLVHSEPCSKESRSICFEIFSVRFCSCTLQTGRDNHKPVFKECSSYAPVVQEEMAAGTFVLQVHAEDEDPPNEGGTITYTLATLADEPTNLAKFKIDKTGVITTTRILDRDEPKFEKEEYITVFATDNGKLQKLFDFCTFKVTIEDVNDNAPLFNKVAYSESVPQDLPVGKELARIFATDIDTGNNSLVSYSISAKKPKENGYFRIDENYGVLYLNRKIDKKPDYKFRLTVTARDKGTEPKVSNIDLEIGVVQSRRKAPSVKKDKEIIRIPENFSNYYASIVRFTAFSNIKDQPEVKFKLIRGQTNENYAFSLIENGNTADIVLSLPLDYERTTEYSLIVRVENEYHLTTETAINIQIEDVNDNVPKFPSSVSKGWVLENQPPGTAVMQVRAIDIDGTAENNQIEYFASEMEPYEKMFAIDPRTGYVTTLKTFDREEHPVIWLKVIASDNSQSAFFNREKPNMSGHSFMVEIIDMNDNPPIFAKSSYGGVWIKEDAKIHEFVTAVEAGDRDTTSVITYSIVDGNTNNSFYIEPTTGKIRVADVLDYETTREYTLEVMAFDGVFNGTTLVHIDIENVYDLPPIFLDFDANVTVQEGSLPGGCLMIIAAYDPNTNVHTFGKIEYSIVKDDQKKLINIDYSGCLSIQKPLNRDPPNGRQIWSVDVMARIRDRSEPRRTPWAITTISITLIDVNDNAPFLDKPSSIVWNENQKPGKMTKLIAKDYDSPENGPPFHFYIDPSADDDIQSKFSIKGDDFYAIVTFDREERKSYNIPIAISDGGSPQMTGTSVLKVIIGDVNDNAMMSGESSIFVYSYKGKSLKVDIGRVYVEDPDDWDLADKHFAWASAHDGFDLDPSSGMITMLPGKSNESFRLKFLVTEQSRFIKRHKVTAYVNVTVKDIPEEAVKSSGSVRFLGINSEDFIAPNNQGVSKKDIFQQQLATFLNTSLENVDVFTVLHSPRYKNTSLLDVRFSVRGSSYYAAEKLNTIMAQKAGALELEMEAEIYMLNIDECLVEKNCAFLCHSILDISELPYSVLTNTTSFVGVRAVVNPKCLHQQNARPKYLNGGKLVDNSCKWSGNPHCEQSAIGFRGNGWAVLSSPGNISFESTIEVDIAPEADGLVFYFGPMIYSSKFPNQDFMALEVKNGYALLSSNFGSGTVNLEQKQTRLIDGSFHRIRIQWSNSWVGMNVDDCVLHKCLVITDLPGTNKFLNVNSPLQIGGTLFNLTALSSQFSWKYSPNEKGFIGCINNIIFNGNVYDVSVPAMSLNANPGCKGGAYNRDDVWRRHKILNLK